MSYANVGHETNIRLSQNVKISLNTYKTKLGSNNILIVGATGEGKSRYFVRPFAYSMPVDTRKIKDINGNEYNPKASFVFTDPKGELFNDTAGVFKASGYDVKVLNLVNMGASDCYNPFKYIYYNESPDNALEILIDGIVNVAKGQNSNADPHWTDNAKSLLNSIAYYVYYELPAEHQNFDTINKLVGLFKMGDDDEEAPIDKLYRTCQQFPLNDHPCIKWRNKISARGGELSSIVSSADTALRLWTNDNIKNIMNVDNINLDTIGDKPTALYVITPVSNATYDNIIATFYNQLFETLMYKAESVYNNKGLPHHVFVVQDEFANTGKIPSYDKKIATFRSCNISSVMIVQSSNQLKAMYDKEYQSIADNAHITIFLGNGGLSVDSSDASAAGFISHALGKTTIRTEGQSLSYQSQGNSFLEKPSISTSINIQQRDLMTPEEVRQLPADECLVLIKGELPIRDKKTDLDTCLNYGSDLFTDVVDGKDGDGNTIKVRKLKECFKSDINKAKSTLNNYKLGLNNCPMIDKMSEKNVYNKIVVNSQYNMINQEYKGKQVKKEFLMNSEELTLDIMTNVDKYLDNISKNPKLCYFEFPDSYYEKWQKRKKEKIEKERLEREKMERMGKEKQHYEEMYKRRRHREDFEHRDEKEYINNLELDKNRENEFSNKNENIESKNDDFLNILNKNINKDVNNDNGLNNKNVSINNSEEYKAKRHLKLSRSMGIENANSIKETTIYLEDLYKKYKNGEISKEELKKGLYSKVEFNAGSNIFIRDESESKKFEEAIEKENKKINNDNEKTKKNEKNLESPENNENKEGSKQEENKENDISNKNTQEDGFDADSMINVNNINFENESSEKNDDNDDGDL